MSEPEENNEYAEGMVAMRARAMKMAREEGESTDWIPEATYGDLEDYLGGQESEGSAGKAFLNSLLERAVDSDKEYSARYSLVLRALAAADQIGYPAGLRIDPEEPEWPVAFIELPTGQVSWHMPQHPQEWDGHTTAEKFERIEAYGKTVGRQ